MREFSILSNGGHPWLLGKITILKLDYTMTVLPGMFVQIVVCFQRRFYFNKNYNYVRKFKNK